MDEFSNPSFILFEFRVRWPSLLATRLSGIIILDSSLCQWRNRQLRFGFYKTRPTEYRTTKFFIFTPQSNTCVRVLFLLQSSPLLLRKKTVVVLLSVCRWSKVRVSIVIFQFRANNCSRKLNCLINLKRKTLIKVIY